MITEKIFPEDTNEKYINEFLAQHKKEFGFILENRKIIVDYARVRSMGNFEFKSEDDLEVQKDTVNVRKDAKHIDVSQTYFEVGGKLEAIETKIYE